MVTGHAVALVDGRIVDHGRLRAGSRVFALYSIPSNTEEA